VWEHSERAAFAGAFASAGARALAPPAGEALDVAAPAAPAFVGASVALFAASAFAFADISGAGMRTVIAATFRPRCRASRRWDAVFFAARSCSGAGVDFARISARRVGTAVARRAAPAGCTICFEAHDHRTLGNLVATLHRHFRQPCRPQ